MKKDDFLSGETAELVDGPRTERVMISPSTYDHEELLNEVRSLRAYKKAIEAELQKVKSGLHG